MVYIEGASPPRRLLVLASTYPRWRDDHEPGFVHELAKRLAGRFHVTVLCPHAEGAAEFEILDGVEVVRYRYAPARWETLVNDGGVVTNLRNHRWKAVLVPGFVLTQAWHTWRLCGARGFDVVHAHWLVPQGLVAALVGWLPGRRVPYLVTSHGADLYALQSRWMQALKRFVLRRAAAATVVSSAMRDAVARLGGDAQKVSVLSMGVDVSERFIPDSSQRRSRDEILFVGRLVDKKGLNHLLRALPEILKRRPATHVTIAGFGPEEPRLRELANALGVRAAVNFLGALPQSDLPGLYRRAAVFVAPFVQTGVGDQEGLPVALMEAIACGCPVLAGNVAGLHDMLGEHAAEVLFEPRDEASLAELILATMSDPGRASQRARRMNTHVRARFGWDRIAEDYAAKLEAIVEEKS